MQKCEMCGKDASCGARNPVVRPTPVFLCGKHLYAHVQEQAKARPYSGWAVWMLGRIPAEVPKQGVLHAAFVEGRGACIGDPTPENVAAFRCAAEQYADALILKEGRG